MRYAIVTDSTADIPADLARRWGIHVVPAIIVLAGRELRDEEDITRETFYAQLPGYHPPPTTAAASSAAFEAVYRRLLAEGASGVISIHCAATLSGLYNAARLGAEPFGDRVTVIDSGQLTLGLGFQVLAAAEAAAQGASRETILARIASVRQRVRVIAMLDTLEYLRRSGRVSWARAGLGALLRIKPFVEVRESEVISLPPVRTRRKGLARLRALLEAQGPLERLALLHTNAAADAQALGRDLPNAPATPPLLVHVTPVIGVHVGPNGVGFAVVVQGT